MRFRWTVFGHEITTIEFGGSDDDVTQAIRELLGGDITGGSAHNFERDGSPLDPNDRYDGWDDKKLGFR